MKINDLPPLRRRILAIVAASAWTVTAMADEHSALPDPADAGAVVPPATYLGVLPGDARDYLERNDAPRLAWPHLFGADGRFAQAITADAAPAQSPASPHAGHAMAATGMTAAADAAPAPSPASPHAGHAMAAMGMTAAADAAPAPSPASPHAGHAMAATGTTAAADAAPPPPAGGRDARGVVRTVDVDRGRVTIKHGPIERLEMPGMTMVFRVRDRALLAGIEPGAEVGFDVEIDGTVFYVTGFGQ